MYKLDRSLCPDADKKYEHEAFTLPSLIGWLETMPADGEYNFYSCGGKCLLHQYSKGVGFNADYNTICAAFYQGTGSWRGTSNSIAVTVAIKNPMTFGAALTRAREYAARTP